MFSYTIPGWQNVNLLAAPGPNQVWSIRGIHIDNTSDSPSGLQIESPRSNIILIIRAQPRRSFMVNGPPDPLGDAVYAAAQGDGPLQVQLWVSEVQVRPAIPSSYMDDTRLWYAQGFHTGSIPPRMGMGPRAFTGSMGPFSWARPPRVDQAIPIGPGDPDIRLQMQVRKKNKDARIDALIERVVEE